MKFYFKVKYYSSQKGYSRQNIDYPASQSQTFFGLVEDSSPPPAGHIHKVF